MVMVNGTAWFSCAELEGFVTYLDFDAKEYRYQELLVTLDVLIEKVEREKFCGVRMLGRYLQHAYLSFPNAPCCDCAFVEMARNDHCGLVKDCAFFCACENEQEIYHEDV